MSASILAKHFSQKRFSRQRITNILNHKFPVERFDLLTLEFFIVSQEMEDDDPFNRYKHFLDEIQDILGISRPTAYNLVKQGVFHSVRVGGHIRISKKSFDDWLDHTDE